MWIPWILTDQDFGWKFPCLGSAPVIGNEHHPLLYQHADTPTLTRIMSSSMRALIVDDRREDSLNLRSLLGHVPEIEVLGEAHTLAEAIASVASAPPDLVFLDIELGQQNGFDLLEHLPATVRVIFTTVHTDYGADAFDVNAVDYLVKPVCEDRLLRALAKLRTPEASPLTKVQVYRGGGNRHQLALEAVAAIIADRNYSIVVHGSHEYPDNRRFGEWVALLADHAFTQLDRSTLLRLELVHSWAPHGSGAIIKFRNSPVALPLGRAATKRFHDCWNARKESGQ